MADRILQIDDDWKRQAQEEKRRLAEQQREREQQQQQQAARPPATPAVAATLAPSDPRRAGTSSAGRDVPEASFENLVQTLAAQAMYYLGEYAGQDGEPMVDLDAAKAQLDTLGLLEVKCKGNLTPPEQAALDGTLYELRMRYVSIATQMIR